MPAAHSPADPNPVTLAGYRQVLSIHSGLDSPVGMILGRIEHERKQFDLRVEPPFSRHVTWSAERAG